MTINYDHIGMIPYPPTELDLQWCHGGVAKKSIQDGDFSGIPCLDVWPQAAKPQK